MLVDKGKIRLIQGPPLIIRNCGSQAAEFAAKINYVVNRIRVATRPCGGDSRVFLEINVKMQKFTIGQTVRYTSGTVGRPGASGTYKVVRVLPLENDEQLYRIKSAHEAHERVARESQLDRAT
jgi:hypothetical protein